MVTFAGAPARRVSAAAALALAGLGGGALGERPAVTEGVSPQCPGAATEGCAPPDEKHVVMLQVQQFLREAQAEAEETIRRDGVRNIDVPVVKRSQEPSQFAAGHFPHLQQALEALDEAYEGHARDAWFKAHEDLTNTKPLGQRGSELLATRSVANTYGELLPTSVADMLAHAGARPGQRYYDLGSGTGKTVLLAWLLGLNATGIELVPKRYAAACTAMHRAAKAVTADSSAGISYVRGSFLEADFSDADVLFTDSVMFSEEMKEDLARAARRLKPGAKVISFMGLPGLGLRSVLRFKGPTSWQNGTEWTIQVVEPSAGSAAGSLAQIGQADKIASPPVQETCSL